MLPVRSVKSQDVKILKEIKMDCPNCKAEMDVIQNTVHYCSKCKLSQPVSPKKNPSLMQQAVNLTKSTVKHVATGMKKVSTQEIERRLRICNACDQLNKGRCAECGCFVNIKASWVSERCPLGKWESVPNSANLDRKHPKKGCGCGKKKR